MKRLFVVLGVSAKYMTGRRGLWLCPNCNEHQTWKSRGSGTSRLDRKCKSCNQRIRVTLDRSNTGRGRIQQARVWDSDCGCVPEDNDGNDCDDCAGVPDGDNLEDNCGTCDSDISNDCVQDCAGTWGGDLVIDECNICDGDNSTCADCNGVPNGDGLIMILQIQMWLL